MLAAKHRGGVVVLWPQSSERPLVMEPQTEHCLLQRAGEQRGRIHVGFHLS